MSRPLIDQALTFGPDAVSKDSHAYFPNSLSGQYVEFTVYVTFSTGSAAGKIQIQTADDPSYAGAWANVGNTIDWAAETSQKYVSVTGVFKALRLNIDTAITTGTVSAYLVAAAGI